MTVRKPLTIYNPMHKSARVIAALLTAIETALENDGASIEPGSIDTAGMTIVVDGTLYRLEIREESRLYPSQEDYEPRLDARLDELKSDRDWMSDSGDDIAF